MPAWGNARGHNSDAGQGSKPATEGQTVINEALSMAPGTIGFRSSTALDESPETRNKTRLAVARAKEGDHDALRYLYVSYSHNVYGYVRSIVRDDHEAEDVTQHVFAKLMTSLVKYDDRGVPFFAWLLRLARNVAIDHLRANRLLPTEEVLDPNAMCGTRPRPRGDRSRSAGDAPRRAAPSGAAASRRRPDPRRDRRPHGPQRGLDSRAAPPRTTGFAARAAAP